MSSEKNILAEQLEKYYGYLNKGKKNPAYEIAKEDLENLKVMLIHNINIKEIVKEFISVFELMSEHGFPMGKAQYPGPGLEFKILVDKYMR